MLYNCQDWESCSLQAGMNVDTMQCPDGALQCLWDKDAHPPLEWDCAMDSLRLAREVPLFHKQPTMPLLDVQIRRGAGRDRDGNWYWIDDDESSIRCLRNGTYQSILYWAGYASDAVTEEQAPAENGERTFTPQPPPQGTARLRVAFTARHPDSEIERLAAAVRRRVPGCRS